MIFKRAPSLKPTPAFAGVGLFMLCCLFSAPASARQMDDTGIAVLRTIDKLSARTSTFEVPVDKTVKFGKSLYIKVRACRKATALDTPESAAFLQIWEKKQEKDEAHWVFSGWMFASNPSVSAMDHPVYDVWVIDCKDAATAKKAAPFTNEVAPAAADMPAPDPNAAKPVSEAPAAKPADDAPAAPAPAADTKLVPVPDAVLKKLEKPAHEVTDGEAAVAAPEEEPKPEEPKN